MFDAKLENAELRKRIDELNPLSEDSLSKKLERAMICLEIMNELELTEKDDFALANNWIDPYWWAESVEEEKRFGAIVLDYFEKALSKGQVPSDQFFAIKYLMAEINRRMGNSDNANKIFDDVIYLTENDKEQEVIHNLAVQQRNNPKDNL
jgi:hypothetical protein